MINNNNNNNNNNGDDEQHWHWWVSGGSLSISGSDLYDETSLTSSSESVLFDGNSFKPFESLTQNNQFHHVIAINETHVVYLEGDSDKTAALLDLTTKTWSNFALFPNVSHHHENLRKKLPKFIIDKNDNFFLLPTIKIVLTSP